MGLPGGTNPGKELLAALEAALDAGDETLVEELRQKVMKRRKEIWGEEDPVKVPEQS